MSHQGSASCQLRAATRHATAPWAVAAMYGHQFLCKHSYTSIDPSDWIELADCGRDGRLRSDLMGHHEAWHYNGQSLTALSHHQKGDGHSEKTTQQCVEHRVGLNTVPIARDLNLDIWVCIWRVIWCHAPQVGLPDYRIFLIDPKLRHSEAFPELEPVLQGLQPGDLSPLGHRLFHPKLRRLCARILVYARAPARIPE